MDADGTPLPGDPIEATATLLRDSRIVAVQGSRRLSPGGAGRPRTGRRRAAARKHREDKPFAVMAVDLEAAARLGEIGETERATKSGDLTVLIVLAAGYFLVFGSRLSGLVTGLLSITVVLMWVCFLMPTHCDYRTGEASPATVGFVASCVAAFC